MKWGLEVRELTLDCQGFQVNDASIIYFQISSVGSFELTFLNIRPEHIAICIWLSCETLNMQSPAEANLKGVTQEVFGVPRVFQSIYSSNHET